jgi:hypothetical protein
LYSTSYSKELKELDYVANKFVYWIYAIVPAYPHREMAIGKFEKFTTREIKHTRTLRTLLSLYKINYPLNLAMEQFMRKQYNIVCT